MTKWWHPVLFVSFVLACVVTAWLTAPRDAGVRVEYADADVLEAMRLDINTHEEVVTQLQAEIGDLQQLSANTQNQIDDLNNLIKDLQSHEEVPPKSHEDYGQDGEGR
jgi:uncharacterized protein YlxW (UPF0749 family)